MHDQVAVGQLGVDRLDPLHGQHVAGRLARELVSAVAGSDRDGQGIDARALNEVDRLIGVGEQLVEGQLALGAVAVLLFAGAVLERAQAAQLAFDGHAEAAARR